MSDYLTRLAARALGTAELARPRRSIFEPRPGVPEPLALEPASARVEAEAQAESPERAAEPAPPRRRADAEPRRARDQTPAPEAEGELRRPPAPSRQVPRRPRRRAQPVPAPAAEVASTDPMARGPTAPERPPKLEAALPDAAGLGPAARLTPQERVEPPPLLAARPPPRAALPVKEASSPTVRVTIGRVDVRAVATEPSLKPRRKEKPAPRMSLDEYLGRARRDGA
jgi:hypothetical protein